MPKYFIILEFFSDVKIQKPTSGMIKRIVSFLTKNPNPNTIPENNI